jgi:hypothetical protein
MDHPVPDTLLPEAPLRPRSPSRHRPFVLLAFALALGAGSVAQGAAPTPKAPGNSVHVGLPQSAAKPGERKGFVVEGDDHLFMVSPPEGWVLDDTSGMGSRIRCVFYPKGQKWATAPTVMYVNPLHGYTAKIRTVSALINNDVSQFMKRSPKGRVTDAGRIATAAVGKEAIIRYFSEDGGPPHEAVAYVPEKDLVMLVVLSSRTSAGFQKALPAYKDLLSTYAWVGTNKEFGR